MIKISSESTPKSQKFKRKSKSDATLHPPNTLEITSKSLKYTRSPMRKWNTSSKSEQKSSNHYNRKNYIFQKKKNKSTKPSQDKNKSNNNFSNKKTIFSKSYKP